MHMITKVSGTLSVVRGFAVLALLLSSLAFPRSAGAAGPSVEITSGPDDPSLDGNPSFSFSSPDVSAVFHCSIDGGTAYDCSSPEVIGAPEIIGSLAYGEHTFTVWAEDTLGVWGTEDIYTWSIGEYCYVDINVGGGADNGSDWGNAYDDLQQALQDTDCKEIWVAAGTYLPDGASIGDWALSFTMVDGVEVYGGFAGGEGALEDRDFVANPTTLSGEITGNNSYHVVTGSGVSSSSVLDGFTITDGFATGAGNDSYGAGMYIYDGAPTLAHLTFLDSYAAVQGGGMYIQSAFPAPVITDSTFDLNEAGVFGGAIYASSSSPTITRTTFTGNHAGNDGGAIVSVTNAPTLTNVTFFENSASDDGGAIFNTASDMTLTNVTFSGNTAGDRGGAMYSDSFSDPLVHNSIFWPVADGIYVAVADTTTTIVDSIVDGACPDRALCTNVQDSDPVLGPLQDNGGSTKTMALQTGSTAVDTGGANAACASVDQRGVTRPQGAHCDMGAYERTTCYVDHSAVGANDGTSWADSYADLQDALGDEFCGYTWVAEGVYKPDVADPLNRALSFNIPPGFAVYGGFDGSESLLGQRDWEGNLTVLSGDIDGDDNTDPDGVTQSYTGIQNNNSYHVVLIDGTVTDATSTTRLDGFTITAGKANGAGLGQNAGGLLCNGAGFGSVCNPTLENLDFLGNFGYFGGALENHGATGGESSPTITNVTFGANRANDNGGGIFNYGNGATGLSAPVLTNVTFAGNTAGQRGGAIINGASGGTVTPTIANATFVGNDATNGGAIANWSLTSGIVDMQITNASLSLNTANKGGGISNDVEATGSVSAALTNVILWDDSVSGIGSAGPEIYNENGAAATVRYSVVEGSLPGGIWDASLGTDGGNNVDANPLLQTLADNGGLTQTMALQPASSAVNAGDDAACSGTPVNGLDQRGISRPRGPQCDIGSFERIPVTATDFDADSETDPAKFTPITGIASWLKSTTSLWDEVYLGNDVSSYVPRSDFDGDYAADPAKFVQPAGALWYLKSSDGQWDSLYVGTDYSASAAGSDFDGDIKTDPAKYLVGPGAVWYYKSSTGLWQGVYIGSDAAPYLSGSDYDGDGMTDMAKYVPAVGAIWYLRSSDSTWVGVFIGSDGVPVSGSDFDGDGRTDAAKYVASANALWYFESSTSTWQSEYLGPGPFNYVTASDFDGDGRTDPAKYVPGVNSLWYLKSTTGLWEGVYMGGDTYEVVN
jgi:predicted outer membrane repeat protein